MKKIMLILALFLLAACGKKEIDNPFDNIDTSEDVVFKDYVRQKKGVLVPIDDFTYFIEVSPEEWEEYDKQEFVSLDKKYFEFDPSEMTIYTDGLPFYTLDCNLEIVNPIDSMLEEGITFRPGFRTGETFMIHNDTYYLFSWPEDILKEYLNSPKRLELVFDITSDSTMYTDNIKHIDFIGDERIEYYNLYDADFISIKK